jgi:hypothetical protein
MALTRTTTPALTTQVKSVGLTSSIVAGVQFDDDLRAFLETRRSLLLLLCAVAVAVLAFRFDLSALVGGLGDDSCEGAAESPNTADSGTMPIVVASTRLDGPGRFLVSAVSFLERPRAAAAHDSSVERLARKAASWSAW